MKKTEAIDEQVKYTCEFCQRDFLRESTILKHVCETKRRWLAKDLPGNRIGYQAFVQFYKKNSASGKLKTPEDFIRSPYYAAFAKFGTYCVDINAINISVYSDWLLKNQIKLDKWCQDTTYNKYLCEYLRLEDPYDAITRSIQTTIDKAQEESIQSKDYLRYGNINKICYNITTGKISPWLLYQSSSGVEFLSKIIGSHEKMIIDYINPEQWALKFKRDPEMAKSIKELLNAGGY
jgi:hypothetical protein